MIIRTVIAVILSAYARCLTLRHNMHMFQLNGYKNDEHLNWIKKNIRQQWLLCFGLVLGILRVIFPLPVLDIFIYLTLLLDILVYRALRRINTKKKLVYTARVKRMIATILVLTTAVFVICAVSAGIGPLTGVCIILVSAQLFLNIIANIINHPVEKAISNYYINDAKRILKADDSLTIIGVTGS